MKFKILTLFPEIFPGPLSHSISGKALQKKLFEIKTINIRDFSKTKSKTVDDKPFGGGAGMIIKPNILQDTLNNAKKNSSKKKKLIFLTPSGKKVNSRLIQELIKGPKKIVVFDNNFRGSFKKFKYQANKVTLFKGDIRKSSDISKAIKDCEEVYDCAGVLGTHELVFQTERAIDTNIKGAFNVIQSCLDYDVKRIYHQKH